MGNVTRILDLVDKFQSAKTDAELAQHRNKVLRKDLDDMKELFTFVVDYAATDNDNFRDDCLAAWKEKNKIEYVDYQQAFSKVVSEPTFQWQKLCIDTLAEKLIGGKK